MKINEVESLVGVTRRNIRFYENEGLLTPARNKQNGYREYGEAEVEELKKIKLLRKLGVPLDEIRRMQAGPGTVGDGMRRHLITLGKAGSGAGDGSVPSDEGSGHPAVRAGRGAMVKGDGRFGTHRNDFPE